jgi:hypothetical protein
MSNLFEKANSICIEELILNDFEFQALTIFGYKNSAHALMLSSLENRLHEVNFFIKKFELFCSEIKYDVKNNISLYWTDNSEPASDSRVPIPQLKHPLASSSQAFYQQLLDQMVSIKKDLDFYHRKGKPKSKSGPIAAPICFSKFFLVSVKIYEQKEDLEKFRKSIEKNGYLHKVLNPGIISPDIFANFFISKGPVPLSEWKSQNIQIAERKLLHRTIGKEVRSTNRYPDEIKKIRDEVFSMAQTIKRKII